MTGSEHIEAVPFAKPKPEISGKKRSAWRGGALKRLMASLLLAPEFQQSLLGQGVRRVLMGVQRFKPFSVEFRTASQTTERPHYAYCMLHAAQLARELGHDRISALEFGVAGGNGLVYMTRLAAEIEREVGVAIDCYGFDTGEGMPDPEGPRDLPYWFERAQYRMDEDSLRRAAPEAGLVIGNVRETLRDFLETRKPAPIGVIFNDTDYWSSTRDSFVLFEEVEKHYASFLPRIFMYFDDVIGTDREMYGPFNGQLAAIDEFNARGEGVRIHRNQNLLPKTHLRFRWQIYYAHIPDHPDYQRRIGHARQGELERLLRLKSGD